MQPALSDLNANQVSKVLMKRVLLLSIMLFIHGCSNPSIVNVDSKATAVVSTSSVIYVSRFEGGPDYVDAATDFFIAELEGRIGNRIIAGSSVRQESTDVRSGGNIAPANIALQDAKANGADILIVGKVAGHKTGATLNGFSTVHVYEVSSGDRIANFHRPSGKLMGYSVHQLIMAAVERTAKDVAAIF